MQDSSALMSLSVHCQHERVKAIVKTLFKPLGILSSICFPIIVSSRGCRPCTPKICALTTDIKQWILQVIITEELKGLDVLCAMSQYKAEPEVKGLRCGAYPRISAWKSSFRLWSRVVPCSLETVSPGNFWNFLFHKRGRGHYITSYYITLQLQLTSTWFPILVWIMLLVAFTPHSGIGTKWKWQSTSCYVAVVC